MVLALSLNGAMANAQQANLARIAYGSSRQQVATIMGQPTERIEKEVKRQTLWIYPTGTVVFSKGRAVSIFLKGSEDDILSDAYKTAMAAAKPTQSAQAVSPVEDIITEILREVPSDGTEGGAAAAPVPAEMRSVTSPQ
jgi:hypothetical protein